MDLTQGNSFNYNDEAMYSLPPAQQQGPQVSQGLSQGHSQPPTIGLSQPLVSGLTQSQSIAPPSQPVVHQPSVHLPNTQGPSQGQPGSVPQGQNSQGHGQGHVLGAPGQPPVNFTNGQPIGLGAHNPQQQQQLLAQQQQIAALQQQLRIQQATMQQMHNMQQLAAFSGQNNQPGHNGQNNGQNNTSHNNGRFNGHNNGQNNGNNGNGYNNSGNRNNGNNGNNGNRPSRNNNSYASRTRANTGQSRNGQSGQGQSQSRPRPSRSRPANLTVERLREERARSLSKKRKEINDGKHVAKGGYLEKYYEIKDKSRKESKNFIAELRKSVANDPKQLLPADIILQGFEAQDKVISELDDQSFTMAKMLDTKELERESAEEDRQDNWERNIAAGNVVNFDDPEPILSCDDYDQTCVLIQKSNFLTKVSDIDFGEEILEKDKIAEAARNILALNDEVMPLLDQCSISVLGNKTQLEDPNNPLSPYRCNVLIRSETKNHKYKLDVAIRGARFTVNHHWPKEVITPIQQIRQKYLQLRAPADKIDNENCDIMLRPTTSGRNVLVYRRDRTMDHPKWVVLETINSPANPELLKGTRCQQPIKSKYITL